MFVDGATLHYYHIMFFKNTWNQFYPNLCLHTAYVSVSLRSLNIDMDFIVKAFVVLFIFVLGSVGILAYYILYIQKVIFLPFVSHFLAMLRPAFYSYIFCGPDFLLPFCKVGQKHQLEIPIVCNFIEVYIRSITAYWRWSCGGGWLWFNTCLITKLVIWNKHKQK